MRIVIDKATLKRHRACTNAYICPSWNEKEQALIYENWPSDVDRMLSNPIDTNRLEWLVTHKLVPMTMDEFIAAKAARGDAHV